MPGAGGELEERQPTAPLHPAMMTSRRGLSLIGHRNRIAAKCSSQPSRMPTCTSSIR
jgi:hypothetical protein